MPKNQTQQGASANARQTAAARRSSPSARSRTSPATASAPAKSARPNAAGSKPTARKRTNESGPSPLKTLRWWLLPAGVFAVLALFVLAYYPVARVQYQAVRERSKLQAELNTLNARNKRLQTRVATLETTEGVEVEARTQLGMVKKGESLGIVLDGDEKPVTNAAPKIDSDAVTTATVGPWTAFLDAVFGVK